jgi:hypothetical protein
MIPRPTLDPEHTYIFEKLEELEKNRTRLIMYVVPIILSALAALLGFSYEISNRLGEHLEVGAKLGARLDAESTAISFSLRDKYTRHMATHLDIGLRNTNAHQQLNHRIERIEDHDQAHFEMHQSVGVLKNPVKPIDPEEIPQSKPFIYDSSNKTPAVYNPKGEPQ